VRVAFIGEGHTEFYCLPKIAGRLGNVIVANAWARPVSTDFDWERFFELRVVPLVIAQAIKQPHKIVVVLDREDRDECTPDLARRGLAVILTKCGHCLGNVGVSVVISNRYFECLLFADYTAVDGLKILRGPVSHSFPDHTEGERVLGWLRKGVLRAGCAYHKIRDGMFLAGRVDLLSEAVLARNRSLRKLVSELT
jgi:hypothetical protein